MPKIKLHWQILIALALAVAAGMLSGRTAGLFGVTFYQVYGLIGTLFLNALKMIIVPLIVSAIITGVTGIGGTQRLGRLGGRTLVYYLGTSLVAILTGLAVVNLIAPGVVGGQPLRQVLGLDPELVAQAARVQQRGTADLLAVFIGMIPPNIVAAAAEGQMLGLIFFSLLFGFFMTRIGGPHAKSLHGFWQGVFEVMMRITDLVIRFAPLGVFGLVAKTVADVDKAQFADLAQSLGLFLLSVLVALAIHAFVTLPLLLRLVARVSPWRHYRAVAPALLTAFSTASSSATLPLTMECVEKRAGVSNRTSSFVLPLGATVNMDGTALYECVAVLFIAQAYGFELDFATELTVMLLALLTSIGVAGIPAASLVAITVILAAVGLPLEALGLILAVDRVLDMFRTAVNVLGDTCGAVLVARLEGEGGVLQTEPAR